MVRALTPEPDVLEVTAGNVPATLACPAVACPGPASCSSTG